MLSFVILSWNSEKYLKKCFESIIVSANHPAVDYEIIIIDNGSTDHSKQIISHFVDTYPHIFNPIYLHRNMGTTYSRNLGLKQAAGDYICILDSDTEILGGDFFGLTDILDNHEDVAIIVPKLILPDGSIQNSVKHFPTPLSKLLKIPKVLFSFQIKDYDFYQGFPFQSARYVDTAISACWLMKKAVIDSIGLLDERIFYSPEDVEYCMRIHRHGKKVMYYPYIGVLHNTQQITHKRPFSKHSISHFWGLWYYFRKYGVWR